MVGFSDILLILFRENDDSNCLTNTADDLDGATACSMDEFHGSPYVHSRTFSVQVILHIPQPKH